LHEGNSMRREDLRTIAQLLTTYWQGQEPNDLAIYNACYQLARLVLDAVPRAVAARIEHAPLMHAEKIIATLNQLLEREPAARPLAESLLGIATTPARATLGPHPNIAIHGSNNQISVGPHLGPVTQIMNLSPSDQQGRISQGVDGGGVSLPTQAEIANQQQRLTAHRATLAVLLRQLASLGADHAPPGVHNGIIEARAGIAHCTATLRSWGIEVEDHPDDEAH
jgi:hypothetical protein